MLVAIFGLLFLGGDADWFLSVGVDSLQDSANSVIVDDERRSQAKGVLKAMDKRLKSYRDDIEKSADQFDGLIGDYDSSDERLDAVWDDVFGELNSLATDLTDLRFELKEHVTKAEWEQMHADL